MEFFEVWWVFLIIAVASYLFGNLNTAILVSKAMGRDIRKEGSGNPGTMNMSRVFGVKTGLFILVLDIIKGVIPTLVAGLFFGDALFIGTTLPVALMARYCAGFFVVAGHIFPAFYKFKGGKGIASTIGVFLVAEWYIALIFGVVALAFIFITRIGSMGSFLATTPPAIFACIDVYTTYYKMAEQLNNTYIAYFIVINLFILGIVFLTWFAHRQNIERLLSGDEHPTDWLQMVKDLKLKKNPATVAEDKRDGSDDHAPDGGDAIGDKQVGK
ncbi:MAG: glycerol-3-phosphate acyltransferase [Clostridia bacterium]|nr:glycerol-3-phosphate acyltransferase [Clostridia bacterium]